MPEKNIEFIASHLQEARRNFYQTYNPILQALLKMSVKIVWCLIVNFVSCHWYWKFYAPDWKFYWNFCIMPLIAETLTEVSCKDSERFKETPHIESIIESFIQRHQHWKFHPTPPTLKVVLKVLSNATDSSKEADEVDGCIGEDGQVLPQLEGGYRCGYLRCL